MSDDKKTDGPDDDGWGAAADQANAADDSATAPGNPGDWKDPANLDERVAALRASEQKPTTATPAAERSDSEASKSSGEHAGTSDSEESAKASDSEESVKESSVAVSGEINTSETSGESDGPSWIPTPAPEPSTAPRPVSPPTTDMRAVAGIESKKDADSKNKKKKTRNAPKPTQDGPGLTRRQKIQIIVGATLLVLAGVVAILGYLNQKNYYLTCGTKSIRAEQGRFWPTGKNQLSGAEFRPIVVPSDALCQSQTFDARAALEDAFLAALLDQSTRLLTTGGAEQVDTAEEQLEQALLLTRAPERSEQRKLAERLKGDVAYWRGAAEVERAVEILQLGATSFEEAASRRPRHSSDSGAWAEHARFIAEEIQKGPRELREDEDPVDKPHFEGLADSPKPKPGPDARVAPTENSPPVDAGVPTQPPADADVPPVDAALPRGGVLL